MPVRCAIETLATQLRSQEASSVLRHFAFAAFARLSEAFSLVAALAPPLSIAVQSPLASAYAPKRNSVPTRRWPSTGAPDLRIIGVCSVSDQGLG